MKMEQMNEIIIFWFWTKTFYFCSQFFDKYYYFSIFNSFLTNFFIVKFFFQKFQTPFSLAIEIFHL